MMFLLTLIFVATAAASPIEDGCYDYDTGVGKMAIGEERSVPGHCEQIMCSDGGIISAKVCPEFQVLPEQRCVLIPQDPLKHYPACCSRYQCPK